MEKTVNLQSVEESMALMGRLNSCAQLIQELYAVRTELVPQGLVLSGEPEAIEKVEALYWKLLALHQRGNSISPDLIRSLLAHAPDEQGHFIQAGDETICLSAKGRPVQCKTPGQKRYTEAMRRNELCFAIGPAGTGKTYLAVAMAVRLFREHQISRIILTRPAVEAGEKLGFLPGDLQNKVDPYMRPLFDALYDLMGAEAYLKNLEKGLIEISPLAYMRGRTLDDAFIILDEAQNTSPEQMKMFLTRIGFNSRAVVTGDITQIDLPKNMRSGLKTLPKALRRVESVAFVELTAKDIVRNPLVQRILEAYEQRV